MIKIKRAYEKPEPSDGLRVLIDRLWPRGITKEKAGIDEWLKELAPSTELRKWFSHDPGKWAEFRDRYTRELTDKEQLLDRMADNASRATVTLVYGARDTKHNNAVVLKELIETRMAKVTAT